MKAMAQQRSRLPHLECTSSIRPKKQKRSVEDLTRLRKSGLSSEIGLMDWSCLR